MRLYMFFFLRRNSLRGLPEEGEFFSRPSSALPLEESSVRLGHPPTLYKRNGGGKRSGSPYRSIRP
jgi:hypothetical protein